MRPAAIIFDFDGVIADSEIVTASVFSRFLSSIGLVCTADEVHLRYFGLNRQDQLTSMAAQWGDLVPADIAAQIARHVDAALDEPFQPIAGLLDFLAMTAHLPRAIASSNSSGHIRGQLRHLGVGAHFGEHIYSGREHVTRGKPHPDLYLHAAAALGIHPADALVIEDSPVGVAAGVAAGAQVIGLCAGSHCQADHGDRLLRAGAHYVFASYAGVAEHLALARSPLAGGRG